MSDNTESRSTLSNIDDWNASANFESPYSEKIQRLHALFDKARIRAIENCLYIFINDKEELELHALPLSESTDEPYKAKDAERFFKKIKGEKDWRFILSMDSRETFNKQIRSTGINPEHPINWKFLRAHPINCLDKTLLLEHQKPAGYLTFRHPPIDPKNVFGVSANPKTANLMEGTSMRFVVNTGNIERTTERGALLPIPEHC